MRHIVEVAASSRLAIAQIRDVLNSAWNTKEYVRFNLASGAWIQINYNRDNSVVISTNSRDLIFYNESQFVMRMPTPTRVEDFVYRWIYKLRK